MRRYSAERESQGPHRRKSVLSKNNRDIRKAINQSNKQINKMARGKHFFQGKDGLTETWSTLDSFGMATVHTVVIQL